MSNYSIIYYSFAELIWNEYTRNRIMYINCFTDVCFDFVFVCFCFWFFFLLFLFVLLCFVFVFVFLGGDIWLTHVLTFLTYRDIMVPSPFFVWVSDNMTAWGFISFITSQNTATFVCIFIPIALPGVSLQNKHIVISTVAWRQDRPPTPFHPPPLSINPRVFNPFFVKISFYDIYLI